MHEVYALRIFPASVTRARALKFRQGETVAGLFVDLGDEYHVYHMWGEYEAQNTPTRFSIPYSSLRFVLTQTPLGHPFQRNAPCHRSCSRNTSIPSTSTPKNILFSEYWHPRESHIFWEIWKGFEVNPLFDSVQKSSLICETNSMRKRTKLVN